MKAGDQDNITLIIKEFFIPFVRLRIRKKGYAISLIKAGAKLIDKSAGNVRAPLVMPVSKEVIELEETIKRGRAIISQC